MSRAAYDRARAEYVKSHSRERRLRLAWLLTEYVAGRNGEDIDIANTGFWLRVEGVDMGQLNALCDSIKSGLTSPMLQRFALYSSRIFYHLFRYVSKRIDSGDFDVEFCDESYCMPYAPKEHHCATLRAAFLEAEHALIFLPRTTLSKMETVADAPHSS
jgi:hypothetical protein